MRIACFVSSHGFGHAARAAAVMEAAFTLEPTLEFDILTSAPDWVFRDSLSGPFVHHPFEVDPGLAQLDAFSTDFETTARLASAYLEDLEREGGRLARLVKDLGCVGVLADIAPLGLVAGHSAGLPTLLLESFTWDQVFGEMAHQRPEFLGIARGFRAAFELADLRVQTEPAIPFPHSTAGPTGGTRDSTIRSVGPVARGMKVDRQSTRRAIGVPEGSSLVLLTLGGVGGRFPGIDELTSIPDTFFVIPGSSGWEFGAQFLRTPTRSGYFHPDLVAAADAVVGKLGYSTLAEAFQGGTRYGFVPRADFAETSTLQQWVQNRGQGLEIDLHDFTEGRWHGQLEALLAMPEPMPPIGSERGRFEVARLLLDMTEGS